MSSDGVNQDQVNKQFRKMKKQWEKQRTAKEKEQNEDSETIERKAVVAALTPEQLAHKEAAQRHNQVLSLWNQNHAIRDHVLSQFNGRWQHPLFDCTSVCKLGFVCVPYVVCVPILGTRIVRDCVEPNRVWNGCAERS